MSQSVRVFVAGVGRGVGGGVHRSGAAGGLSRSIHTSARGAAAVAQGPAPPLPGSSPAAAPPSEASGGAAAPPHLASLGAGASGDPAAPPHLASLGAAGAGAEPSTTHFGFKTIPKDMKEDLVRGVFSSVASSYDVMNDAMSLGIHRLWKDHYVSKLDPHGAMRCLDVAGGTGDIAFRLLENARRHGDRQTSVQVLDINAEMLAEGEKRFAKTIYAGTDQVSFTLGNAEKLDAIPSDSLDLYTIAFGIRNCTHIDRVLSEAYRVLKPGGVFSCLEFSKVTNPLLASVYDLYSFQVIPNIGHIVAADRDSYQYLVESIARFPSQHEFSNMIRVAGFVIPPQEPYENLTFGIAAIHTGVKL